MEQHEQESFEMFNKYNDVLVLLANCVYPKLETKMQMELALDQFIDGIRNEHIQDILLQSPPESLNAACETAR